MLSLVHDGAVQEDDSVIQKRRAVKNLFDKIKVAIDDVQYLQEKLKRKEDTGDIVSFT